ncbi:beta-1,4 N-acetylgalactosaminyltransferase 2-like [Gouania willdenowi]|uniref:beta-1,4 N-acetylgalactosaminyltransferase 2-like n=1 Tax=Gouania willdenowi TaxID=441366 RepID=UPI001054B2E4|nr:beta-1,4 N-acetylgalactosaminyltransferase 2-like [Gouania willdenowi]XP_028311226.1 beta-1,4 N-acetylgalactosaminyltransferase 2-like [Gouania willdenowi]
MVTLRHKLQLPFIVLVSIALGLLLPSFYKAANQAMGISKDVPTSKIRSSRPPLPPSRPPQTHPCTCANGSMLLKDFIPPEQYEELQQQRAKEWKQYKERTTSVLSKPLYALPNSPLQYPIQGFTVQPLQPTLIPGLGMYAETRNSYKVVLKVSRGILNVVKKTTEATVEGEGSSTLTVESSKPHVINELLSNVSYTSAFYHINSGDLATFQFEDDEVVFPIAIKRTQMPILYKMGKDISSQVTIVTKTFLRYPQLKELINSIRLFYTSVKIIIADDSIEPQKVSGENIEQYIMPPSQGWFAGRNLGVSQVTTKYFLWVDDDFLFTKDTKIEKFVEMMEANPDLDLVGGSVKGTRFYFSLFYEEGDEEEGGCLYRKSDGHFHTLPGYPECILTDGVVNFFLARTDSVRKVGFDPKLQRVAHSEVFMDGMGSLMIASCSGVSIGHQSNSKTNKEYMKFRNPTEKEKEHKKRLHFSKNHLKCIKWG